MGYCIERWEVAVGCGKDPAGGKKKARAEEGCGRVKGYDERERRGRGLLTADNANGGGKETQRA